MSGSLRAFPFLLLELYHGDLFKAADYHSGFLGDGVGFDDSVASGTDCFWKLVPLSLPHLLAPALQAGLWLLKGCHMLGLSMELNN